MKANDLRIGNYVKLAGETTHIRWFYDERKIFVDILEKGMATMRFDELEPIPLTEEWLLKLGFKKSKNLYFDTNEGKYFSYIKFDAWDNRGKYSYCLDDERGSYKPLDYVHQLQNLYYALTNEELILQKQSVK